MVGPPSSIYEYREAVFYCPRLGEQPSLNIAGEAVFICRQLSGGKAITKQDEKDTPQTPQNQPEIQYGFWPFFRAWIIAGTITGVLVMIAKYFKLL